MHHPPEPHFSFTIPSIHDDTTLDCRIFHPREGLRRRASDDESTTRCLKKGIIMAHPYAPLGGSYDDRVVCIVVEEFLALGYVVGTFNFRGAHGSKGHTSWSGKPEVGDYISFAALFIHYISYIQPHPTIGTSPATDSSSASSGSPVNFVDAGKQELETPTVILGGYSHGSLILQHLPPLPSILQPFATPAHGSAAHEIVLRARKLSEQSNLEWINLARDQEKRTRDAKKHTLSVKMGGEETNPDERRSSREGRRSADIRHAIRSLGRRTERQEAPTTSENMTTNPSIQVPKVRYLLISPLTGPISFLAAPGLSLKFWHKAPESRDTISKRNSLVLYGDQDIFSSAKKVTAWVEKMEAEPRSQVSHVEVAGAGHFWAEHGVEAEMRKSLRAWEAETWT